MESLVGALIGLTVAGLVALAWYSRRPGARSAAHTFARKVDLALDRSREVEVGRRIARREQAGIVGGLLVAAATTLALGVRPPQDETGRFAVFLLLLAFFAGRAAGCGVVAWYESMRPVDLSHPRIARTSSPDLSDYVPGYERIGARVIAGVALAVAFVVVLLEPSGVGDLAPIPVGLALAAGVGPPIVCLVGEVVARRLLLQRQVATSTLDLAWDDALRARTLRDVTSVAIAAGCYAPLILLGVAGSGFPDGWPANTAVGVVDVLVVALLVGMVAMAVVSLVRRPEAHVRRQLWPREDVDGPQAVSHGFEATP